MQILQGIAANNPAMQQAIQMASQGNPQQAVMNLAKEKGISAEQLQQMAGQFGIRL